jgi:hypothetical protein
MGPHVDSQFHIALLTVKKFAFLTSESIPSNGSITLAPDERFIFLLCAHQFIHYVFSSTEVSVISFVNYLYDS